jgi:hypothetical protein
MIKEFSLDRSVSFIPNEEKIKIFFDEYISFRHVKSIEFNKLIGRIRISTKTLYNLVKNMKNKNRKKISGDEINSAIKKTYEEGISEIYKKINDNYTKLQKICEKKYFFYTMFYALYKLSYYFLFFFFKKLNFF